MTNDRVVRRESGGEAQQAGELRPGRLSAPEIVFFVVAAAAPMAVFVGTGPNSLRLGGVGLPGVMIVTGVILLLFASGFTAMSRYARDAGAFYAYVSRGLGVNMGNGTAVMTTVAYGACVIGFTGYIGYYASGTASSLLGVDLPWQVWSLVFAAIMAVLGFCQVDIGAKVLAILLTLEVGVIVVLVVSIWVKGGPEPVSAEPFTVDNVLLSGGSGTLFMLAFGSYLGFEGTAIYAEEAKRPERTIPIATYVAVGFLSLFYAVTLWTQSYGFGVRGSLEMAQSDDFLNMAFIQSDQYAGKAVTVALEVLIVTSFFACILAFHNACTRYLYSLGRGGLLPRGLAKTHRRMHSPYFASVVLSVITFAALGAAMVFGLDPFLQLGNWSYASGVIGIVAAQALCAFAVVFFFRRDQRGHSWFRVVGAPLLGGIGLAVAVVLIVAKFDVISGYTDMSTNMVMISVMPVSFLVGIGLGWVRRRRGHSLGVCEPNESPTRAGA